MGDFENADVPLEALDVLTYLVVGLLLVTLLFIGCQMTIKDNDDIEDGDITEQTGVDLRASAENNGDYVRVRAS